MVSAWRARLDRRLTPAKANFVCHLTEGVFASFGSGIVGGVVLQLVIARLGYSAAELGFLTSLGVAASFLQFVAAPAVEAARRKKRLVMLLGIPQRLPLLIVALGLLLFGRHAPAACLAAIAVAQVMGGLAVSVLFPPWMDLLAETIPEAWRGRLFGWRASLSSALGLAAAAVNAAILARFAFPGNFVTLYLLAFGLMMISWLIFSQVDEVPAEAAPKARPKAIHYFRDLFRVLRDDGAYRWYLLHQALTRLGECAGFYAMYAAKYCGVSSAFAAGAFVAATQASMIVGNSIFGPLADRIGAKRMLQIGVAVRAAAALGAAFAATRWQFLAVIFAVGLGHAAATSSGAAFTMRLFPRGRRVGYMALSALALLPVGMAAAAGIGLLLDRYYSFTFFCGGLLTLTTMITLERCRLPDAAPEPKGETDG